MAADSDGTLKAVVICEGDLHDPDFPRKFRSILGKLKSLLEQPKAKKLKVNKVEPWNSVRVTLSIPKEAAIKLRQLAAEGSHALRALGILSVQLEGDTVISLRVAGQEIVIRTDNIATQESVGLGELTRILSQPQTTSSSSINNTASSSSTIINISPSGLDIVNTHNNSNINSNEPLAGPSTSNNITQEQSQLVTNINVIQQNGPIFKSPNTVCPMDGKLPVHVPNNNTNSTSENCEYPFESMTQARVIQRRENTMSMTSSSTSIVSGSGNMNIGVGSSGGSVQFITPPAPPHHHQQPPPPYPSNNNTVKTPVSPQSVGGNIAITSPLLVNLLQNEGGNSSNNNNPNLITTQTTVPSTLLNAKSNVTNLNLKDNHELIINNDEEIIVNSCNKIIINKQQTSKVLDNNIRSNSTKLVLQQNIQSGPTNTPPSSLTTHQPVQQQQMIILNASGVSGSGGQLISSSSSPSSLSNVPSTINISNNNSNNNSNLKTRFLGPPQPSQVNIRTLNSSNLITGSNQTPHHHSNIYRYQIQNQQQQQSQQHQQSQLQHPLSIQQPTPPTTQHQLTIPPPQTTHQQFRHPSPSISSTSLSQMNNISSSNFPSNNNNNSSNNNTFTPRWPLKPMDSATKSSYQEFARYQMQYNLIQQQQTQNQQNFNVRGSSTNNSDLFGSLDSDLTELSKNDLDSLIPTLSANDALAALLLDPKDLDLDLIEQQNVSTLTNQTNISSSLTTGTPTITSSMDNSNIIKQKQMLINPLTGELEPMPSEESSSEAEIDDTMNFQEFNSEISNSFYSDDENSCSTGFSKTTSDQSDTERSNLSDTSSLKLSKNRRIKDKKSDSKIVNKRERNNLSKFKEKSSNVSGSSVKITNRKNSSDRKIDKSKSKIITSCIENSEKIKLRLKLEKSEPVNPAYKVDVSFIHSQSPKRALSSSSLSQPATGLTGSVSNIHSSHSMSSSSNPVTFQPPSTTFSSPLSATSSLSSSSQNPTVQQSPAGEELRVPPLHISLRGRNSVVIKNSKKDRKKSSLSISLASSPTPTVVSQNSNSHCITNEQITNSGNVNLLMNSNSNIESDDLLNDNSKKVASNNNKNSNKLMNHNDLIRKSINSTDYFDDTNTSILQNRPSLIVEKVQNTNSNSSTSSCIMDNFELKFEKENHDSIMKSSTSIRDGINPNGILICPEKKRKLSNNLPSMSQSTITTGTMVMSGGSNLLISNNENDDYMHINGPIGSTNVGTLPHSSLVSNKIQKGNTNLTLYNNKLNKTSMIKTGKPIIKSLMKPILLPQTNADGINEEKFKQKLLENNLSITTTPLSISSSPTTSSPSSSISPTTVTTSISISSGISITSITTTTSPLPISTTSPLSTITDDSKYKSKLNNSTNYNKELKSDVSKKIEINHSSRPPENMEHQHRTVNNSNSGNVNNNNNSNNNNNTTDQNNIIPVVQQRGSPNSQAQGEDSGIESMDALSEKSPNQITQSPQDDNKHSPNNMNDSNNKSNNKVIEDFSHIDIEAALADMEGIITSQNLNGDHSTIITSSTTSSSSSSSSSTTSSNFHEQDSGTAIIATKSNDILLNELMMTPNNDENENKDIKINFDDECCNNKMELNINETRKIEIKESIKLEPQETTTFITTQDQYGSSSELKDVKDHSKLMLTQLSIEIPVNEDQNLPRVRTRASSKLESPLDTSKQSPLDSPANCLNKSGLKLSQAAIDRLSPKISKPGKRKRQGSESSTQSCVSDDNLGRSKKVRKSISTPSSVTGTSAMSLAMQNIQPLDKTQIPPIYQAQPPQQHQVKKNVIDPQHSKTNHVKQHAPSTITSTAIVAETLTSSNPNDSQQPVKKIEDSSDSDEPLSEIANSKSKKVKPLTPIVEFEKGLRNHKITIAPTTTSTTPAPLTTQTKSLSSTCTTSSSAITTVNHANPGVQPAPTIRNLSVKIQSCDDKISTRRSVRMTSMNYAKGSNKVANSLANHPPAITNSIPPPQIVTNDLKANQQFLHARTGAATVSSAEQQTEARRKTRSAGLDSTTDGRRRRGSRDGK